MFQAAVVLVTLIGRFAIYYSDQMILTLATIVPTIRDIIEDIDNDIDSYKICDWDIYCKCQ
jgi:hypothetical protein